MHSVPLSNVPLVLARSSTSGLQYDLEYSQGFTVGPGTG